MSAQACSLQACGETLVLGERALLMGIVSASPVSPCDGGSPATLEAQVKLATELLAAGADILDVGAASAPTNGLQLPVEQEIERVVPLVERVTGELGALVSIDTDTPAVAAAAVQAGARIVNDVSGLRDPELANVCASSGAALVLICARAAWLEKPERHDNELFDFLTDRIELAGERGVDREQLIINPGTAFAKSELDRLHGLDRPLLLDVSRSSFVGISTDSSVRAAGTLAALAHGLDRGVHIFRLHDVAAAADFITVRDALAGHSTPGRDLALGAELRYDRLAADPSVGLPED